MIYVLGHLIFITSFYILDTLYKITQCFVSYHTEKLITLYNFVQRLSVTVKL